MNNIESIKAKIRAANDAAIAELLEKARQDGASFAAQADARIAELNGRTDARIAAETEQARRIAVSGAELSVKKDVLGAKQTLIAEAFEEAVRRLCSRKPEEYLAEVIRLSLECPAEGGSFRPAKAAAKILPADALERVNRARTEAGKQPFTAGEPSEEIRGGFVVEGKNWRQVCSFESLVAQYREELEPVVASALFGTRS